MNYIRYLWTFSLSDLIDLVISASDVNSMVTRVKTRRVICLLVVTVYLCLTGNLFWVFEFSTTPMVNLIFILLIFGSSFNLDVFVGRSS